jgi:gluconate 5-dehydrogenase
MPFDLRGKVALVTGAGRGLGRAFAQFLAEAGADVVCISRSREPLEKTVELVKPWGQRVLPLVVDVSKFEEVEHMVNDTLSHFGRLDIAINNAGVIHKPRRFHELPLEEWNYLIAVDLTGVFMCMQKEIEAMIKQQYGTIINIASILGLVGLNAELMPRASYMAAKHGVLGLTKQAALEYAREHIRVNAIAPGWFGGTDLARERLAGKPAEDFQQREQKILEFTPMRRRGNMEELKGLLLYLASDASSFVTGQVFVADGGWTAH